MRTATFPLDGLQFAQDAYNRFQNIPEHFPNTGLIVDNLKGKRIGIWIMPDNTSIGMLETFLCYLVPNPNDPIFNAAQTSVANARSLGAPFKEPHISKANIHTWLAWQDPPGRQLHQAVMQRILSPSSPLALTFVSWFCRLFEIEAT